MQALGGIKYIFLTHRDDGKTPVPSLAPAFASDSCLRSLQSTSFWD